MIDIIPSSRLAPELKRLFNEAFDILKSCGVPIEPTQNSSITKSRECAAAAFLAIANIRPGQPWSEAGTPLDRRPLRNRDIIRYSNEHLGLKRSDGSYDNVYRRDLLHPILAGLVIQSAGKPDADTNDGTRGYGLLPEFTALIRKYGTEEWKDALAAFLVDRPVLSEILTRKRNISRRTVILPGGKPIQLGAGPHNELQHAIIKEFLPRYGCDSEVLYCGDTTNKLLHVCAERLRELNLPEPSRGDLPDIVAYSRNKHWVYLIEAVHSSGPISEERLLELKRLARDCVVPIVYVTAFLDRATYRKWSAKIAWETEIWIASDPDHLIHLNGCRFLGPYDSPERR